MSLSSEETFFGAATSEIEIQLEPKVQCDSAWINVKEAVTACPDYVSTSIGAGRLERSDETPSLLAVAIGYVEL